MSFTWDSTAYANMLTKCQGDLEKVKENLFQRLSYIGESAVKTAREMGNYQDRTGNLRSSIGYFVMIDGEVVSEGGRIPTQGTEGDGSGGITASQALMEKLKSEIPATGAVLVVTAGMQYAWYVENLYGKDVLASAELKATQLANKLLKFSK